MAREEKEATGMAEVNEGGLAKEPPFVDHQRAIDHTDPFFVVGVVALALFGAALNRLAGEPIGSAALPVMCGVAAAVLFALGVVRRASVILLALLASLAAAATFWAVLSWPGPFDGVRAELHLLERDNRGRVGESTFVWIDYSGLRKEDHDLWLFVRAGRRTYQYYPKVTCHEGRILSRIEINESLNSWADTILMAEGPVFVLVAATTKQSSQTLVALLKQRNYCPGGEDFGPRFAIREGELPNEGFRLLSGQPARAL